MTVTADFFPPWEGPPPNFATAPADAGLASRIDKLSEFASRNGPKFVRLTLQKQQGTDFDFLSGGEGHDYYRWVLYCHLEQLDPGKIHMLHDTGTQNTLCCRSTRLVFVGYA